MSLETRDVSHTYRGVGQILSNVSLTIDEGETVALMGPSGSGKSTLLSILGLLLDPTDGTVLLDGRTVPLHVRSRLRATEFSWIFQSANVLKRRTATDNVAMSLMVRGINRYRARGEAATSLSAVGLADHLHRPTRLMSGGEVQRVCIARAVAAQPRFVLADEPTGQLDRATSDTVVDALFAARTGRTSLVIATHDPVVAQRCDRVLHLLDGTLHGETK